MFKVFILCFVGLFYTVCCEELSFDLPDKERMCFQEILKKGAESYLEYQVIEGGNFDVDVNVNEPSGVMLYHAEKKQYDRFEFTAQMDGEYTFCFSNEFSHYTHKVIYFDFFQGEDDYNQIGDKSSPMTQMESTMANIRRHFTQSSDHQTHHRLRESQARGFAENLNERVQYWSIGQTVFILVAGIGQLLVLKSLFVDKKTTKTSTWLCTINKYNM